MSHDKIECPVKANYHLLLIWELKTFMCVYMEKKKSQYVLVWGGILFRSDQTNVITYMVNTVWEESPCPLFFFLIVLFSRKEKTYDSTSKNYTIYKTDNQ